MNYVKLECVIKQCISSMNRLYQSHRYVRILRLPLQTYTSVILNTLIHVTCRACVRSEIWTGHEYKSETLQLVTACSLTISRPRLTSETGKLPNSFCSGKKIVAWRWKRHLWEFCDTCLGYSDFDDTSKQTMIHLHFCPSLMCLLLNPRLWMMT